MTKTAQEIRQTPEERRRLQEELETLVQRFKTHDGTVSVGPGFVVNGNYNRCFVFLQSANLWHAAIRPRLEPLLYALKGEINSIPRRIAELEIINTMRHRRGNRPHLIVLDPRRGDLLSHWTAQIPWIEIEDQARDESLQRSFENSPFSQAPPAVKFLPPPTANPIDQSWPGGSDGRAEKHDALVRKHRRGRGASVIGGVR